METTNFSKLGFKQVGVQSPENVHMAKMKGLCAFNPMLILDSYFSQQIYLCAY